MRRSFIPSRALLPSRSPPDDRQLTLFDDDDRSEQAVVAPPQRRFVYQERTREFIIRPEHEIIFRWVSSGSGNGMIEACAGGGKTGTLIEVLRMIEGQIFFGAFGRRAMFDIKEKAERARMVGYNIQISTMHGAGMSAWLTGHEHVTVEQDKVSRIIEAKFGRGYFGDTFIRAMVSYGKQMLAGINFRLDDFDRWKAIMLHFGADDYWPEGKPIEQGFTDVMSVFETSLDSCDSIIDYDDMLYAPLARNCVFKKRDWVLGDEWQDANPARQALIESMLATRGRALLVGDRNQAIFGFTGASADAMDIAKRSMNCMEMKLTTTWRCSEEVVKFANQWVPELRAREGAPKGDVRPVVFLAGGPCPKCLGATETISGITLPLICGACGSTGKTKPAPWYRQDPVTKQDAILCRYNRPLIQTAYNFIREGTPVKVEGRDVGTRLVQLARMWKLTLIEQLEPRLQKYLATQIIRARAAGSITREMEAKDRVDTLRVFIEQCIERGETTIESLCQAINAVFEDNVKDTITLSTPFKFKGRERVRIFWLQTEVRRELQAWEHVQEQNVMYVTATRARDELILVPEDIHTRQG